MAFFIKAFAFSQSMQIDLFFYLIYREGNLLKLMCYMLFNSMRMQLKNRMLIVLMLFIRQEIGKMLGGLLIKDNQF